MKTVYENEYGRVEIRLPDHFKKIGISLSGGTDSALMSYLFFKHMTTYNLEYDIYFVSGIIKTKGKWKKLYVIELVDFFREIYPEVNIVSHDVLFIDDLPEMFKYEKGMIESKKVDLFLNATTQNPPMNELEKNDMIADRLENRDEGYRDPWRKDLGGIVYKPFINVNKKFVAQGYRDHNLMDNMFKMTISCEKRLGEQNYSIEPCKKCWWCKEKKWSFNLYDGESS